MGILAVHCENVDLFGHQRDTVAVPVHSVCRVYWHRFIYLFTVSMCRGLTSVLFIQIVFSVPVCLIVYHFHQAVTQFLLREIMKFD